MANRNEKFKFVAGEKVLCTDNGVKYEAKCLEMAFREGRVQILVHYMGWNSRYDEWVDTSKIEKIGPSSSKPTPESDSQAPVPSGSGSSEQAAIEPMSDEEHAEGDDEDEDEGDEGDDEEEDEGDDEQEDEGYDEEEDQGDEEENLKKMIADDWHNIVHQKKLCCLPCIPTMAEICEEFANSSYPPESISKEILEDTLKALMHLFDLKCQKQHLFFKEELLQKQETADMLVCDNEVSFSQVYGGPHLIRFLSQMGENPTNKLLKHRFFRQILQKFKKFIVEKGEKYMNSSMYSHITLRYQRMMK